MILVVATTVVLGGMSIPWRGFYAKKYYEVEIICLSE
jgi:hypothetical protein